MLYRSGGWLDMGGSNAPLQGGKFADLEGGTRATAFVSGGLLPAARRGSSEPGYIHAADWFVHAPPCFLLPPPPPALTSRAPPLSLCLPARYATFLGLAGLPHSQIADARAAAAGLPPLDSLDVWPLLSGSNATSPRVEIPLSANPPPGNYSRDYCGYRFGTDAAIPRNGSDAGGNASAPRSPASRCPGYLAVDSGEAGLGYYVGGEALISGPWKLVTGIQHSGAHDNASFMVCGDGVSGDPASSATAPGGCLFHIIDDPTESNDQAAALPALMNKLLKRQHEIRAGVFAPHRGLLEPGACLANNASGGFWAPWLPAPPGWPTFL